MIDVTVREPKELEAALLREGVERLILESVTLKEVPAALGNMKDLVEIAFDNCELGAIDPAAFNAGKGPLEVRFMYSQFDEDALFKHVLVHGQGNWRIKVFQSGEGYQQDPRWKLVAQLGDDGLGDAQYREQSFALLRGWLSELPKEPGAKELRLLDHAKKNIRELALAYLEPRFPDAVADGLPEGAKLFAIGKATYHDKGVLETKLAARNATLSRTAKGATHVLVMAQPGDKLDAAIATGLPIVLEAHLKRALAKDAAPAPKATPKEAGNLSQLLLSVDEANQMLALEMVKAREIDGEILPLLLATILFSESADVRKRGRELIATHGSPKMVAHFQGDKRNYVSITDGAKLGKLAKEFSAGFGLNPMMFTRALVQVFSRRKNHWAGTVEPALVAALQYPENENVVFGYLSDWKEIFLPSPKKRLWSGLSALTSLERLRIPGGSLTVADNLEELGSLPNPIRIELWVKAVNLKLLAPLAKIVCALEFRGAWSELTDLAPLAAWKRLVGLDVQNTGITDVSPLVDLPLQWLRVGDTKLEDVTPLAKMKSLTWLDVQRIPAEDLSSLAALTELTSLNMSFTAQKDLRPFKTLTKLKQLELWGVPVNSLEPLVGLPLESLTLSYAKQPDLSVLGGIPTLRSLTIIGVEVPADTLAELQKKLPNLSIRQ